MKKLLVFIVTVLSLHTANAAAVLPPDSSKTFALAQSYGVDKNARDTFMVPVTNPSPLGGMYRNNVFKRRLDSVKKEIPLDYNEYVQSYIDLYLSRREDMARVLGLTRYYFPIYEKIFRDSGIPEELKYLSIVESQLNPNAVSRMGATGPWQFMSNIAKSYGLNMDGYVDERRDPIQSSYAAAAYLKDAYQQFGDWLLAIASYNCGKSNVIRAIEQAGGVNNFWAIRQYLPAETRGYVPAYIAVTYVMKYYWKYNIHPQNNNFSVIVDTVAVKKMVSLSSISHALNIDPTLLGLLNPGFRQQMVNGSDASPKVVVLPKMAKEGFATAYNTLTADMYPVESRSSYAMFAENSPVEPDKSLMAEPKKPVIVTPKATFSTETLAAVKVDNESAKLPVPAPPRKSSLTYINYRVQQGDTITGIANKFNGASADDIKKENGINDDDLKPGMLLQISKS